MNIFSFLKQKKPTRTIFNYSKKIQRKKNVFDTPKEQCIENI